MMLRPPLTTVMFRTDSWCSTARLLFAAGGVMVAMLVEGLDEEGGLMLSVCDEKTSGRREKKSLSRGDTRYAMRAVC